MKTLLLIATFAVALTGATLAGPNEFDIKKIDVQFIKSPEFQVNPNIHQSRSQQWMEIEVTFEASPKFTEELAFNYYVSFKGHLLVGHVNHVAIQKDRELRSVAYISPKALAQLTEGKQIVGSDIENVAVTITKPGIAAPLAEKTFKPGVGRWWETMKAEEGFILNKSETPFAPLFWDRYEALKASSSR